MDDSTIINNKAKGWVSIYRSLREKWYYNKSEYVHLWLHLLLKANHSEAEFRFNGKTIRLKAGQLIAGRTSIAHETGINESKIQRILKCFENEHQIEQQTTPHNRLITILSWYKYQNLEQPFERQMNNKRTADEQPTNIQRTTSEQPANTYNKINNNNNSNNINNEINTLCKKYFLENGEKLNKVVTWNDKKDNSLNIITNFLKNNLERKNERQPEAEEVYNAFQWLINHLEKFDKKSYDLNAIANGIDRVYNSAKENANKKGTKGNIAKIIPTGKGAGTF